jgi:hypothetical protein
MFTKQLVRSEYLIHSYFQTEISTVSHCRGKARKTLQQEVDLRD